MTPEVVARLILAGFEQYRDDFRFITSEAKQRFEQADWPGIQQASMARIELYRSQMNKIVTELDLGLAKSPLTIEDWLDVKTAYGELIKYRVDAELAETIYNTIIRKSENGQVLSDQCAFVTASASASNNVNEIKDEAELVYRYGPAKNLKVLLQALFDAYQFDTAFEDLDRDIKLMMESMQRWVPLLRSDDCQIQFELMRSVFYRNKGAYLVGRMHLDGHEFPIAIPIHNGINGLYVDTIIWNGSDLSIIFSFTRSYFMVEAEDPARIVSYLHGLLPNKKRWELYTALGFYKHGKTEFYRGFLKHLGQSDDQFVVAEGIKGLVMAVFTLPSYQVVFKIIKDKFSPTKRVTRQQVRDAYYLVKTHDRVGRMADTQEFTDFIFPRERFSQELIEELMRVAASSVEVTEDHVTISHLYTERLMTPLNLYIKNKSDVELAMALEEYGNAIKQLAAANIFPGDMLLKNFGVTRHGRVIFYDYDEICYLTEINFREIPKPKYPEDAMAAEPWYSIGPNDVFPEEFKSFLLSSARLRNMFSENHADLFTPEYWRDLQESIRNQQVVDVYPYRRNRRFGQNEH